MPGGEVTAICKRCGKSSAADKFVLDPVYKMVVCPACVEERKKKMRSSNNPSGAAGGPSISGAAPGDAAAAKPAAPEKPKGWDSEDEFLERVYKEKNKSAPALESTPDGRIRYQCKKCSYKFLYDPDRKLPANCPYCGTPISIQRFMY